MPDIMVFVKLLDTSQFTKRMFKGGWRIDKNPRKRANRKGQGRKIMYPQDLEDKLVAWILEKWKVEFVEVSTQMIRLKA